ncbi:cupin domain-containing protein [Algoriphagus sp. H41]|uniref:Cupin domain-containing protein n=1 Tax=Algoriphagus oliviformis TaxID=2811231 RepID=A0ABS3BYM0_9BACT|nr:cupin domain-containing protein [Algoriphagus oliviformis]MBN7809760.1 cupin domain-containing protein [Algoriphagus oliviformis]
MKFQSEVFQNGEEIQWEVVGEGVKRQILGHDDHILIVKVSFEKGSIGPIHDHFHSQATYVESGAFEVQVNGVKKVLKAGDGFYIPPHAPHGAVCLEPGVLIDVFSPIREDFFATEKK